MSKKVIFSIFGTKWLFFSGGEEWADFLFLLLKDLVKYLLLDITSSKKQFFSQATGLEIRKSVIIAPIMQRPFLWGEEFFFLWKGRRHGMELHEPNCIPWFISFHLSIILFPKWPPPPPPKWCPNGGGEGIFSEKEWNLIWIHYQVVFFFWVRGDHPRDAPEDGMHPPPLRDVPKIRNEGIFSW